MKHQAELFQVISECIEYVGSYNSDSRERHAKRVAAKAIADASVGIEPKWFDETDETN